MDQGDGVEVMSRQGSLRGWMWSMKWKKTKMNLKFFKGLSSWKDGIVITKMEKTLKGAGWW